MRRVLINKPLSTIFFQRRSWCGAQGGFALVLVLGFVVLLTVIILAFFSNSIRQRQLADSSANQTKADIFAQGVLDNIVADLKQEIVDGSNMSVIVTGGVTSAIYYPKSAATVVPFRAGSDPSWTNVVKRSAHGVNFYTAASGYAQNGPSRAANSSTIQASLNGRYYSLSRWNNALLLPPTSASDFTPNTSTAFIAPDWILVAQDGSNPTTWNTNMTATPVQTTSVVGRYAYCIYDEGGLLDMNVAGYPSTPPDNQVPYKNAEAYADLTQLTDPAGNPYITQAQIDQIVAWRNAASLQQTPPAGLTPYAAHVASNLTGFLTTSNTSLTVTGQSDRMFGSRQQMLGLFKNYLGGGFALDNALQFLTTFSRDVNAPTWAPINPSGSNIDYALQRNAATSANRDILGVRVTTSFTRADGTKAQVGDPMLMHRFPLSRLAGLTYQGPDSVDPTTLINGALVPATAATIQRDFGLVWVVGSHTGDPLDAQNADHWNYCGASGTAIASAIATLDTVVQEGREPNFFELVKAAVLSGSLGRDAGANGQFFTHYEEGPASGRQGSDQNVDAQIMQMGANIIDQSDADSYPTEIHLLDAGNNNKETSYYGIENLPYLQRVFAKTLYPCTDPNDSTSTQNIGGWYMAEIWNPHQTWGFSAATTPTQFKFAGVGLSQVWDWPPPPPNPPPDTQRHGNAVNLSLSGSINFTVNSATTCREPTLLSNDSNNAPYLTPTQIVSGSNGTNDHYGSGLVAGLFSGLVRANDTLTANGAMGGFEPQGCSLLLEYLAPTGNYQIYQVMRNLMAKQESDTYESTYYFQHVDPRTDRFGTTLGLWTYSHGPNTSGPHSPGGSMRVDTSRGWNGTDYFPLVSAGFNYPDNSYVSIYNNFYMGTLSDNTTNATPTASNPTYTDPDGILRSAEGAYATETGSPYDGRPIVPGNLDSRPIILNRPFRNVGELGYAFRDDPWRNIDFFTTNSGDAALLDLFCVNDSVTAGGSALVAGMVNVNTRQTPVLQAIVAGAISNETAGTTIASVPGSNSDAQKTANAIVTWTSGTSPQGPFLNRSDLVTKAATILMANTASISDQQIKIRRESALRALSNVTTARTWTLMIDVIAQVGRYPVTATGLSQFLVEGEKRYWLHVSIDRYTGQVIDYALEPVYE